MLLKNSSKRNQPEGVFIQILSSYTPTLFKMEIRMSQ